MANRHNRRRLNRIEQGKKNKGRPSVTSNRPREAPTSSPVKGETSGHSTDTDTSRTANRPPGKIGLMFSWKQIGSVIGTLAMIGAAAAKAWDSSNLQPAPLPPSVVVHQEVNIDSPRSVVERRHQLDRPRKPRHRTDRR